MLDVLHSSDAAILRSGGAWDGGGGFLAGGVDGEMGMGEVGCAGEEEIETCAYSRSGKVGETEYPYGKKNSSANQHSSSPICIYSHRPSNSELRWDNFTGEKIA